MAALSVATGLALLYDEGVLPPNPERQALAFASPAETSQLASEGLAFKATATDLAMEDESANGTEVSPAAMQFLVQNLASSNAVVSNSHSTAAPPQPSGYPYGGWAADPSPALETPTGVNSAPIDVLA